MAMLQVFEYASVAQVTDDLLEVEMNYDLRKRSRIKATTRCGKDIGFFLERGNVLKAGDVLQTDNGQLVKILAAPEAVSTVTAEDEQIFLKAAYHLGNRHVPLEISQSGGKNFLRYLEDYVLDAMVEELGATVTHEKAGFHPESGAYGKHGGHHHHHDDDHRHHEHG
jgi:urease accessory protein